LTSRRISLSVFQRGFLRFNKIGTFGLMKIFKAVILFLILFTTTQAIAQSSADLKRKRDRLNQELDQLTHEYQETAKNKKSTLKQLNNLKEQIGLREEKINNINSEIRLLSDQINQNTHTVHSLQSQLDQLRNEYAAMIIFAYHNQSAYNKLMFIFAAKDFNQAYKRLKYLQEFGNYRQRQAESIMSTQKDLKIRITELDNTKKEKNTLLSDQENEKATLGKQKNEQQQVVEQLSKAQGQLKQQQREIRSKIAQTNREIQAAIRREIEEARRRAEAEARAEAARLAAARAKAAEAGNVAKTPEPVPHARVITKSSSNSEVLNATPEAAKLSNDFLGNRGRLPWPVTQGIVTTGFGMTTIEGIKTESNGWDIRTSNSAPVRAVFQGDVTSTLNIGGTYLVVIRHGEYFTAYSNLRSISVGKGQKVSTKQVIGSAATDPATSETSVHFELYKGREPVDPRSWLAAQ